jgi:hypothetical protein
MNVLLQWLQNISFARSAPIVSMGNKIYKVTLNPVLQMCTLLIGVYNQSDSLSYFLSSLMASVMAVESLSTWPA